MSAMFSPYSTAEPSHEESSYGGNFSTSISADATGQSIDSPASSSSEIAPVVSRLEFKAFKKGGNVKNWKVRYFVFDPVLANLTYFADSNMTHKKGNIDLKSCSGVGPVKHDRFPHALGLQTKDRLWVIAFDTPESMGRVQTALNSVAGTLSNVQEVPQSALGKLKKSLRKKDKHGKNSGNQDKDGGESASRSSPTLEPHSNNGLSDSSSLEKSSGSSSAAMANEKAGLSKLNANLAKLKEYSGIEFTFECDMSTVKAVLKSDHPDKQDQPGDLIYGDLLASFVDGVQDICETSLFKEALVHKCNGHIRVKISDAASDKLPTNRPFLTKSPDGTFVIVSHRSVLATPFFNVGVELLDLLSQGDSLHLLSVKDIDDHRPGIKSCLIKFQAAFNVTYQFECDYVEGFQTLQTWNPTLAEKWRTNWGEIIYQFLDTATIHLSKLADDLEYKLQVISETPSRAVRIVIEPKAEDENNPNWIDTKQGRINVHISAPQLITEKIQF